jgi:hypothetical protein
VVPVNDAGAGSLPINLCTNQAISCLFHFIQIINRSAREGLINLPGICPKQENT